MSLQLTVPTRTAPQQTATRAVRTAHRAAPLTQLHHNKQPEAQMHAQSTDNSGVTEGERTTHTTLHYSQISATKIGIQTIIVNWHSGRPRAAAVLMNSPVI